MIIKVKELQDVCKVILSAVDGSNSQSIVTETLELKTLGNKLLLSVTNREYFVTVKMDISEEEELFAVVDAKLFLSLISRITSDTAEFTTTDSMLNIKANGNYKLPQVCDNEGNLVALPIIDIANPTLDFDISSDVLSSISTYNTKELLISKNSIAANKNFYYIDDQGAITYNFYRACINTFTLDKPVKMILNNKIIKLFGLFKGAGAKFTMGHDQLSGTDKIQTKIKLEDENISLTSIILNDTTMLSAVPVAAIRGRANNEYKYSVNISRDDLSQSINRLMLFNAKADDMNFGTFVFENDKFTVYDSNKNNNESISYVNTILNNLDAPYETVLNLVDIKSVVETCQDKYLTVNFGDGQAVMVSRGNIKNLIPEARAL